MKSLTALLLTCLCCGAQGYLPFYIPDASSAYTYVYTEDFESGVMPSGWTVFSGTVNFGDTTSPSPLVGSFSLRESGGAQAGYTSVGNLSECWIFFLLNQGFLNSFVFDAYSPALGDNLLKVRINNGEIEITDNTVSSATSGASLSTGTTIRMWLHYKAGSGANAIEEVWWSTSDTLVSDAAHHASFSNGVKTAGLDYIVPGCYSGILGGVNVFDKLRVSTSAIGSNPN